MSEKKTVRIGIVGMGNMGRFHADYLLKGEVAHAELAAVSDASSKSLESYAEQVAVFESCEEMVRSGKIDALLIATPHYFHTVQGIDALEQGLHVLTEKPISVHKADCERLLAAHKKPGQVFAAMFQLRTDPKYEKIKKLISSGEMGEIVRVNWINTDWFRTEAYYASGGWRATWKGEGGGVLLNQCPHNLDLLQWFCGMPSKVRGFAALGKYHDIEVEDDVSAYLEYPNGATGIFVTSTGEAPGTNRLEIAGSRGLLVLENGIISFTRNEKDMRKFCEESKIGFAKPDVWEVDIPYADTGAQHKRITQNFVDAIRDGVSLIAPAREGIRSVELANSILYSSLIGQTVELPLDSKAYEEKLKELIAESTHIKQTREVESDDFSKSFSK
ncbi:MAG: Gfo/Idh/MocA family protein [Limisphaerales bacterium]|nr:Gfo/Idh/MocA family oxidoreductase [Verrucomicrobiota bacterium]